MKPQRYGPFAYTPINRRPKVIWPQNNHIALWIVPNIETFPLNEPVPAKMTAAVRTPVVEQPPG